MERNNLLKNTPALPLIFKAAATTTTTQGEKASKQTKHTLIFPRNNNSVPRHRPNGPQTPASAALASNHSTSSSSKYFLRPHAHPQPMLSFFPPFPQQQSEPAS
jgi:hypothetical protein